MSLNKNHSTIKNTTGNSFHVPVQMKHNATVNVHLYNMNGKLVRNVSQMAQAGDQNVTIETGNLTGIYLVRAFANGENLFADKIVLK
ncbi:MAG: T9SS type A sorting domain-containing protein [Chitinivibrionales bacterium]|nr:T9SS type A sorting domain-containing protein [Chitinivibrionales bacterium]